MHGTPHTPYPTSSSLRLYTAGAVEMAQDKGPPLHHHVGWELVYYRDGHVGFVMGDEFYEGTSGVLVATPPRIPHGEIAWTACSLYYLGIDAPATVPWPHVYHDDADHTVENVIRTIIHEWRGQSVNRDEMLTVLVRQLDIMLKRAQEYSQLTAGQQIVYDVEQLFRQRLAASLTINDVAHDVGVSPSALRAYFARIRGQAPLARLHAMRVEHALALIGTSDLSLEVIAANCGYNSASHLSRQVKRATGKSPGRFRIEWEAATE